MHFPYAFDKTLYTPPRSNSVLGMIASYQAGPVIYKRLMEENGVKSIAFVARNEADPLNQRSEGVDAANMLGLEILASEDTYEPGTTDFFPVMSRIVQLNPDLIVLSGVAPSDAPQLIKTARELGYGGLPAPSPPRTPRSCPRWPGTRRTGSSPSAARAPPRSPTTT